MKGFQRGNTCASELIAMPAMNPQVHTEVVLPMLSSLLKALNDNPLGAMAVVTLSAFALVAYVIHKCK